MCEYTFTLIIVLLKVMSDWEHERSSLQDRLATVQTELSMAQAEHAKQRRDMIMKQSNQTQQIDSLQLQLSDTQQRLQHDK